MLNLLPEDSPVVSCMFYIITVFPIAPAQQLGQKGQRSTMVLKAVKVPVYV